SLLCITATAQDMTGIWRGSFVSSDKKMPDLFNTEDKYKYEIQIDQNGKAFTGVTYSYKTTVFYGKASANGTVNAATGKVMLNELKLLELKMSDNSYACWMVCFLQYTKNGDEEFLEGKYSSYRESDSSFCDRGTVFLKRVKSSDFYVEPFLVEKASAKRRQELAMNNPKPVPPAKTPAATSKTPAKTSTPVTKPGTANPAATAKTNATVKPGAPVAATKKNKIVPPPAAPSKTKITPPVKTLQPADLKPAPLIATTQPDKKEIPIKPKEPTFIPPVLKDRQNEIVQTLTVSSQDITVDIYDNGTIDHDTISVFLDKKNIVNHQMLKATPITVKLKMGENADYHELVMVADNLGDIPPNTSLMVVTAGDKRYEVRITSTEQKNAVVIFKYDKGK
ncbi:MAG: hypothetical protein JST39_07680, partial [Bacteroidetes bacterium]|nr:hypothetical protein [Bacteroidota bacterium]